MAQSWSPGSDTLVSLRAGAVANLVTYSFRDPAHGKPANCYVPVCSKQQQPAVTRPPAPSSAAPLVVALLSRKKTACVCYQPVLCLKDEQGELRQCLRGANDRLEACGLNLLRLRSKPRREIRQLDIEGEPADRG